jgi:hypothetical protein
MNEEIKDRNVDVRLSALEIRISALEALVNNAIGAVSPEQRGSKKKSTEEKEKIKAELLKRVPYEKKGLEDLKTAQLKMLASALRVKAFGLKRDDIVKGVLVAQKKK